MVKLSTGSTRSETNGVARTPTLRKSMALSSIYRGLTLPVGAAATFFNAALIIHSGGIIAYALVAIITNLFQLIVFSDLGMGTVVVSFVADKLEGWRQSGRERLLDEGELASLGRVFRLTWLAALTLAAIAWAVSSMGLWPALLGTAGSPESARDLNLATAIALSIFAASIPFGLGQRILLGLQQNHTVTLIGVLAPAAALGWTALVIALQWPILLAGAGSAVGLLLTSVGWMLVAMRRLRLPLRHFLGMRVGRPVAIWAVALPQLALTLIAPIGSQSDRIVLAQLSSAQELASYSLTAQLWTPAVSLISVAVISLWPAYRAAGEQVRALWMKSLVLVGGASVLAGILFGLLVGPAEQLISSSTISPTPILSLLFGILLSVTTLNQVSTLLLMDKTGLRVQFWFIAGCLVVNLIISIILTPVLGASGPVVGTLVAVILLQLIPFALYGYRRTGRPQRERASAKGG